MKPMKAPLSHGLGRLIMLTQLTHTCAHTAASGRRSETLGGLCVRKHSCCDLGHASRNHYNNHQINNGRPQHVRDTKLLYVAQYNGGNLHLQSDLVSGKYIN